MKRQLNVRVSEYTRQQLAALVAATGLSEAGVITLALDRLAQQIGVRPPPATTPDAEQKTPDA